MFILRNERCTSEITKRISIHFGLVLWEKILELFVRNLRYQLNINELIKKKNNLQGSSLCMGDKGKMCTEQNANGNRGRQNRVVMP